MSFQTTIGLDHSAQSASPGTQIFILTSYPYSLVMKVYFARLSDRDIGQDTKGLSHLLCRHPFYVL